MQMGAGGYAGLPHLGDLLSRFHRCSGGRRHPAAMRVKRGIPSPVVYNTVLPIAAALPHRRYSAIGKTVNLRPGVRRQIYAVVKPLLSLYRVLAVAKIGTQCTGEGRTVVKSQNRLFQTDILG